MDDNGETKLNETQNVQNSDFKADLRVCASTSMFSISLEERLKQLL